MHIRTQNTVLEYYLKSHKLMEELQNEFPKTILFMYLYYVFAIMITLYEKYKYPYPPYELIYVKWTHWP